MQDKRGSCPEFGRLFCGGGFRGLQVRDGFEKSFHAMSCFENCIDLRMAPAIGMENQNARSLVRFFHHIRKMMAIIARERGSQDHEIEGITAELLFYGFAAVGGGDVMSGFLNGS